jgi:hypothetical protein
MLVLRGDARAVTGTRARAMAPGRAFSGTEALGLAGARSDGAARRIGRATGARTAPPGPTRRRARTRARTGIGRRTRIRTRIGAGVWVRIGARSRTEPRGRTRCGDAMPRHDQAHAHAHRRGHARVLDNAQVRRGVANADVATPGCRAQRKHQHGQHCTLVHTSPPCES